VPRRGSPSPPRTVQSSTPCTCTSIGCGGCWATICTVDVDTKDALPGYSVSYMISHGKLGSALFLQETKGSVTRSPVVMVDRSVYTGPKTASRRFLEVTGHPPTWQCQTIGTGRFKSGYDHHADIVVTTAPSSEDTLQRCTMVLSSVPLVVKLTI
jgi:hypothetical protein